ncbi:MAG: 6,7-dimethyl-8-ribityllumazine synthase [Arenicellales bacterium]|jgi:6,7-dimethyl-8-ribityllumazine synthase|nr:6,7-dimethyl-8-ribityllumazine synthase [Arenicellales bacterium]
MPNRPTIALVIGSFHKNSCEAMVSAALAAAAEAGLDVREQVWVPGSMEKPLAVKRLLTRNNIDGAVVLGIIERGETAHGRVMGQAVIQALIGLQLETGKPVGIGILGPEILPDQIPPRLVPYAQDAVRAVHAMLAE